jgi:hypothetical protein
VIATAFTGPWWPVNGTPTGVPVARFHARTSPSASPEMTAGRQARLHRRQREHGTVVVGEQDVGWYAGGQIAGEFLPVPRRLMPISADHPVSRNRRPAPGGEPVAESMMPVIP